MSSTNPTGTTPGGSASTTFFGNTPLTPARSLAASSFLAGDEPITIIPSFNHPEPIGLISGQVGPFRAGMNVVVPLWLGTMLRRRKFAKIVPPPWMDVDTLREVLKFERDPQQASFSPELPFRHAEIASAIFSACRTGGGTGSSGDFGGDSEIPNIDKVKLLLEDIATVRMDKIRRNVHTLSSQTLTRPSKTESIINVTHIGSVEVQAIKPFVTESFRMHRELSGKGSSYSYPVQSTNSSGGDSGSNNGNRGRGNSREASENANRGRLHAQLERQRQEDLSLEGSNVTDNLVVERGDELEEGEENNTGRSRLRRHR
ncbi:hypothetical protein ACHAXS_009095 [Conticribra weissflogii]